MAFDGIVTRAVVKQLNDELTGLRVDKIYQVEKDEVLLHFRKNKLLISSSGNNPRIYLTEQTKENPKVPPMFTMVLRKHLSGAIVKRVSQFGNDRVIKIDFDAWDDFSEKIEKSLIVEIMGRHSNIILLDNENIIIDSIKRVSESMSRVRQVLPHLPYEYIKDENKIDPSTATLEDISEKFNHSEGNKSVENVVFNALTGFSKNMGTEISLRANIDSTRPFSSLEDFEKENLINSSMELIREINENEFSYKSYLDGDRIVDFHVLNLINLEGLDSLEFKTPSEMLDAIYSKRDKDDRLGQKGTALKKIVASKLSKDKSKISNLKKDLLEAENREQYRIFGDLLSANFHKVKPGQKEITLQNFYSEDLEDVLIPLDEKISAPINAQRFYKKYGKLKTAENILNEQIKDTQNEIDYLESVLSTIELTEDVSALDEIKDELIEQGYIKRSSQKKKKSKMEIPNYLEMEKDGFNIFIGRNNRENDLLTHKIARRDDIWLHAQGIPGSHVIIKTEGKDVPEEVIKYAAQLAAYNSKGRNSGSIEVDYTQKQNVKRSPANKPGLVNYTNFKTISVDSNQF
ncbi:MAG: fibronectin/fibrinogen-binding protein [Tissierellia bacterium]|nr:fibronectin/fibrinogen-binding protein [Tissierellia bacterium]